MDVSPAAAGFDAARLERITTHLQQQYIDTGRIVGCQAAVSRHGKLAYWRNFGLMDRERQKPVQDDTIFRIYSMTKPITSIALMSLFEEGHFQLSDPVHRFLPEFVDQQVYVQGSGADMETRNVDAPMTMRQILSHTAGLSYGWTNSPVDRAFVREGVMGGKGQTLSDFTAKLAQLPLNYEPGTRWMYSVSTDVCGALVERISGQRFDRFLQERIFDRLGMKDTSFWVTPEKQPRFAANYQREPNRTLKLIDDPETSNYLKEPSFFGGGGGLVGTTADYLRFCEMLRRGGELDGERIIGSRTLELMTMNHLAGGKDLTEMAIGMFSETANEGIGFGLGFAVNINQIATGGLSEKDYYWGGAASTIFWVDPKEDLEVVFMTQLMPSSTFNFRGQLKSIIYSSFVD